MESLNLSIPQQHTFTDPTVERNVNRLREWLTGLPLMDVVETVRLVINALDALNEQQMDTQSRFDSLEAFRTTTQRLFLAVDPLHLRQLTLAKPQRQEAIEGVERLLLSLAGGYKFIVMSLYDEQIPGRVDKFFAQAVNRSMETLVYTLLDCYRFYRATQPCYYAELHQLYRVSRYHGFLDVKFDHGKEGHSSTVAELYHTGILASLMDPFRLAEGEISMLFEVLSQYANRCRIIPGQCQPGEGDGRYQIDLGSDKMPISCIDCDPSETVKEAYILDVRNVLEAVHEQLESVPDKVRMQSPEATLLRQLQPEDQNSKQRGEDRHGATRQVQLLRGIENIHNFLIRPTMQDVLGQAARGGNQAFVKPQQCQILDSSDNGMRLSWVNSDDSDVCVGELIAIVEGYPGQESLQLAILRSVNVYRQGAMDAGVMFIKGGVGAAYCHLAGEPSSTASAALFMTSEDDGDGVATLIAPKGLYEEGRQLLIDVADRQISIRASHLVFSGPVFDRFEFSSE